MGNLLQRSNTPPEKSIRQGSKSVRQREPGQEERKKRLSFRGSFRERSTRKQEERDLPSRQERTEKEGVASQTRLRVVSPMPPQDERKTERQDISRAEDSVQTSGAEIQPKKSLSKTAAAEKPDEEPPIKKTRKKQMPAKTQDKAEKEKQVEQSKSAVILEAPQTANERGKDSPDGAPSDKPVESFEAKGIAKGQGSQRTSSSEKPLEAEPILEKRVKQEPSSIGEKVKANEAAQKQLPVVGEVLKVAAVEPSHPVKASKPIKEVWTHHTAQVAIPEKPQEPQKEGTEPAPVKEKEVKKEVQSVGRTAAAKTVAVLPHTPQVAIPEKLQGPQKGGPEPAPAKEKEVKKEVQSVGRTAAAKTIAVEQKELENKSQVTNTKNLVAKAKSPEVISKAASPTGKLPLKPVQNAKPEPRGVVQSESVVGSSFEMFGARVKTGHDAVRGLRPHKVVGKYAPGPDFSLSDSDDDGAAKDEEMPDTAGEPDKLANKGAKKNIKKQQEVDDDKLPSWKKLGKKKQKDRTSRISILASEAIYTDDDDALVDGQKLEHFPQ